MTKSEIFSAPFVARLRRLRGARTKAEFADFLGLKPPTYFRYEEGRIPKSEILERIARKCDVSVVWLLGQENTPESSVEAALGKSDSGGGDDFKRAVLEEIDTYLSQFRTQPAQTVRETIHQQIALSAKKYEAYCDSHYGKAKAALREHGRAVTRKA